MSFISKILDAFKMESTRGMENSADRSDKRKEMSVSEALSEINRANLLADIANKTTDREEFYNSIGEIENILTELSKYEHKFGFSYPPSAHLRDLRHGRDKQIELLEKRIAEKEKEAVKESVSATDEVREDDILIEEPEKIAKDIVCEEKRESTCQALQEDMADSAICEECTVFDYKNQDEIQVEDEIKNIEEDYLESSGEVYPYRSKRLIISGLHICFIIVAREILEQNAINIIPLMREYKISEDDLNQIIREMQESNVIDKSNTPMMSVEEFERFVDIYQIPFLP